MSRPDLDLSSSDLPSGKKAEVFTRAITTLRDDATLTSLLGGAEHIVPALRDEDPDPALLAIECTVAGSDKSAQMRTGRFTVDCIVMLAPGVGDEADPNYMNAVSDRAVQVLEDGIGGGFVTIGSTDDIYRRRPSESSSVDALVQVGASVQFRRREQD